MSDTLLFLSFRVGQQWYGLPIDRVIKVLHFLALTELPKSPPDVLGLMNVGGKVMPVFDLRRRFGGDSTPLYLNTPIVATQAEGKVCGLVVEEADTVEYVPADGLTSPDDSLSPYISGVVRLADRLLLVLDLAAVLENTPEHIWQQVETLAAGQDEATPPLDSPSTDDGPAAEHARS